MSARKRGKELLAELEERVRQQGVKLAYEKLQFGGLHLKSGLCWFKGRYYLFVDRNKPLGERIDLLEQALEELANLPDPSQRPHGEGAEPEAGETPEAQGEDEPKPPEEGDA